MCRIFASMYSLIFIIFSVFPDPPVGLNWTVLSMGSDGLIYDMVVSWDPPPSAAENLKTGWILLVYETQYREKGSDQWNSVSPMQRCSIGTTRFLISS